MFFCRHLSGKDIKHFAALTYKQNGLLLERAPEDPAIFAIGAFTVSRIPAGLILGEIRENDELLINTLFVSNDFRGLGIGYALLKEMEKVAQERGCHMLSLSIIHDHPYLDVFEALLQGCGWALEWEEAGLVYRLDFANNMQVEPPSMLELEFPTHVIPFFWKDLTPAERLELSKNEGVWYPRVYSPFLEEERMEPLNSLGLKDEQGNIFSWVITQRLSEDTILLRTVFGREEYRSWGYIMLLVGEAIFIQLENGINNLMFNVSLDNKVMSRLIKKLLRPYNHSVKKMLRLRKFPDGKEGS